MNTGSPHRPWSARVYTTVVALALALALTVSVSVAAAQPRLTIEPTMTKGPATAPVTIVEFSDFQ